MEEPVEDQAAIREGKRLLTHIQLPPHYLEGHVAISLSGGSNINCPYPCTNEVANEI